MQQFKALTLKFNGLTSVLSTDCGVCEAFDPKLLQEGQKHPIINGYKAIWDTGATRTCISQKIVNELKLSPIGFCSNQTAAGLAQAEIYVVNILLPMNVAIPMLTVTRCDLDGIDVLIGMDVISKGDFSITNVEGKTTFSFRIPSIETIDYVKQSSVKRQPIFTDKKIGRNEPCPCGSGKKYKNCHGKNQ